MYVRVLIPLSLLALASCKDPKPEPTGPSAARRWNDVTIAAIRRDTPRPPVHARNLYALSAAMYDAWAAFDPEEDGLFVHEDLSAEAAIAYCDAAGHDDCGTEDAIRAAREAAISHAAYVVLYARYGNARGGAESRADFDALLASFGLAPDALGEDGDPRKLGHDIGTAVIAAMLNDGSNEPNNYADTTGYVHQAAWSVGVSGVTVTDPNRWQPLDFDLFVDQGGVVIGPITQTFVGSNWNRVTPFALTRTDENAPFVDPGPPPQFGTPEMAQNVVDLIRHSSEVDPDDGVMMDASPGAIGDNPLGTNEGDGYDVNPRTGAPYASNMVLRADFARVLAEFWADGPTSETPPGHWNVIANEVSDHPDLPHRIGGVGPVVPRLEWDVKLYLTLNGALHDAAISSWGIKRVYDGPRPYTLVRHMTMLGQSSDVGLPSYNAFGLPLVPGLIELVTASTTGPGERHQHLAGHEGEIAIYAWRGQPADIENDHGGVGWILGIDFVPYQRATFVTPAFPGYTSGHSTFSRSAAEAMTAFTGDPYVPGGLGEFVAEPGYLVFESGPTQTVHIQWATYRDAADLAGRSRVWGGIHIYADDFGGRECGEEVGLAAWAKASALFAGTP